MRINLDSMNGEERKAYIAAILIANTEYLDSLAPEPFTIEVISKDIYS